jgi:hypothetical protein
MGRHVLQRGETLAAIARRFGMTWQELYGHEENAAFRALRPDPNVVHPGDELWVPGEDMPPRHPAGMLVLRRPRDEAESSSINPRVYLGTAHLVRYKVRTGDRLETLAAACGCTWQELAKLNWGTDVPDAINWYLENYFVCKQKIGENYVFSDEDEPGILLLPYWFTEAGRVSSRIVRATRFPVGDH